MALTGPLCLPLLAAAGWGLGQRWAPAARLPAAPSPGLVAQPAAAVLARPPGIELSTTATPWAQVTNPGVVPLEPVALTSPRAPVVEALPWPLDGALALGGAITLTSLHEPAMLPMARAELLLQQRNNDPLVALPAALRQPLRLQLKHQSESIETARVVVIPLRELRNSVSVPLVRGANGEVDVYTDSLAPAVTKALEQWLVNLDPLTPGQVQPLLLKLKPWPTTGSDPSDSSVVPAR